MGHPSTPGVAELLSPAEIAARNARERARREALMPKKPEPVRSKWGRLSEVAKGIERLKGR